MRSLIWAGLRLPASLEKEKTMWGLVTKYAFYASREYGEALDAYRKILTEQRPEKLAEEEGENGDAGIDGDMP